MSTVSLKPSTVLPPLLLEAKALQAIHNIIHGKGASLSPYNLLMQVYQNPYVLDWIGDDLGKADAAISQALAEYVTANRSEVLSFLRGDDLLYHQF